MLASLLSFTEFEPHLFAADPAPTAIGSRRASVARRIVDGIKAHHHAAFVPDLNGFSVDELFRRLDSGAIVLAFDDHRRPRNVPG
jgi:hypothetical protein